MATIILISYFRLLRAIEDGAWHLSTEQVDILTGEGMEELIEGAGKLAVERLLVPAPKASAEKNRRRRLMHLFHFQP